ncbi:MAG: hypothetical protein M0Q92_14035 [Methanoregula sp.]|jgi:hypothetical protein|nr:hypothetical protein [Methanoregula sp.]
MNPVIYSNPEQNITGGSFWDRFANLPGTIGSKVPTLDRSLDAYFDRNFGAIIEEWDLLTESDLGRLENRLTRVSDEINSFYAGKVILEARAEALDALITSLEEKK